MTDPLLAIARGLLWIAGDPYAQRDATSADRPASAKTDRRVPVLIAHYRSEYMAGDRTLESFEQAVAEALEGDWLMVGSAFQYECGCGARWGQAKGPLAECSACGAATVARKR